MNITIPRTSPMRRAGFTMVEVLVVMGLAVMGMTLATVSLVAIAANARANFETVMRRHELNLLMGRLSALVRQATRLEFDVNEGVATTSFTFWMDQDPNPDDGNLKPITPLDTDDDLPYQVVYDPTARQVSYTFTRGGNTQTIELAKDVDFIEFKWYENSRLLSIRVKMIMPDPWGVRAEEPDLNQDRGILEMKTSVCARNVPRV